MNSSDKTPKKALIISISSDIGYALALRWQKQGMTVAGTYRTKSPHIDDLNKNKIKTVHCDVAESLSINQACAQLRREFASWDYLVLCPGTLEPVGPFMDTDFTAWAKSLEINFIRQLQLVHELLPVRNLEGADMPAVLFFAGSGTNNAPVNYSAYTISKIALIKMCELLDAELPDTNFVIVGPGLVKTKIHEATLKAGAQKAGANYQKTIDKLAAGEATPMDKVLDCCEWLMQADRRLVGGRNFSTVFDNWGTEALNRQLSQDPNMYKLRRHGNK